MKHEHFEIFKVNSDFINSTELNEFINSGKILPKSISVDNYYNGHKLILIGYEKITQDHSEFRYTLEERRVDVSFHGLAGVGKLIEKEAAKTGGVVCQDIEYIGGEVLLTFLVAFEK